MEKFDFNFDCKPDYGLLTVEIPNNTTLKVEASSMASMDKNIKMKTKMKGGFGRFFTGESIFINEFTAENGSGEIKIAPSAPGDMEHIYLDGSNGIMLQSSGYLASSKEINIDTKWQGFKGFFSGEGLFLAKCSGKGDLWFNSYGGILEIDVKDSYVVDTGHIVAFSDTLDYSITRLGGYKSLFLSGEGLVCKFQGEGKIWIQTKKITPFALWTWPFRPKKNKK
jgi:uncharacterized protein (TIGR00266 family)